MPTNDFNLSGEDRFKAKRRKFWRYLIITFVAFLVAGFFGGYIQSAYRDGEVGLWLPLTMGALVFAALTWFSWDFFRRVDELDRMDNLWAHLFGQYAALLLFMAWYFLADLGVLATYPTAIAVVFTMIGATFIAYGARKLGWR